MAGQIASGTLTNKQISELYTNPVQLIGAPGAGQVIVVLSCYVENVASKLSWNSGAIALTYGNRVDSDHGQTLCLADAPFDSSVNSIQSMLPYFVSNNEAHGMLLADCVNKPVTLTADGDFYGGGGTGRYSIVYKILNV